MTCVGGPLSGKTACHALGSSLSSRLSVTYRKVDAQKLAPGIVKEHGHGRNPENPAGGWQSCPTVHFLGAQPRTRGRKNNRRRERRSLRDSHGSKRTASGVEPRRRGCVPGGILALAGSDLLGEQRSVARLGGGADAVYA